MRTAAKRTKQTGRSAHTQMAIARSTWCCAFMNDSSANARGVIRVSVWSIARLSTIRLFNGSKRSAPTPFAAYVYYHGETMREYGPERLDHKVALRSFL